MNGLLSVAMAPLFVGSLGVAVAIILAGGWVALQWQRQRHRFELMRTAMERGSTLPPGIPLWLISLRQGVLICTLGVGLFVVGVVAWGAARHAHPPAMQPASARLSAQDPPPPPLPPPDDDRARPGDAPPPPPPPPANPAMEQWHQAQVQRGVGMLAMGCGFILILLGIVRVGLSPMERRHGTAPAPAGNPTQSA